MSIPPDDKVVSLFQHHRRGETVYVEGEGRGELIVSPDGFRYVSFVRDIPEEDDLLDIASQKNYVVKLLEHHRDHLRVNHYHVAGEKLHEFLTSLHLRPGKILGIETYYPETTA